MNQKLLTGAVIASLLTAAVSLFWSVSFACGVLIGAGVAFVQFGIVLLTFLRIKNARDFQKRDSLGTIDEPEIRDDSERSKNARDFQKRDSLGTTDEPEIRDDSERSKNSVRKGLLLVSFLKVFIVAAGLFLASKIGKPAIIGLFVGVAAALSGAVFSGLRDNK